MRMKEVCDKTGLTDRAVRLYIENGLLSPNQESSYSGRKSISFSAEDVEILQNIAVLRKAEFSLADIRDMQDDSRNISQILADHREKLAEDIAAKQKILQTLERIEVGESTDCAGIAEAIRQSAEQHHIPKEDSFMRFNDFQQLIRRRIPALLALLTMVIGAVCFFPMMIRTAYQGEITLIVGGGGYELTLDFSWQALLENWPLMLTGIAYLAVIILLFCYIMMGKHSLLLAGGILSLTMVLLLLIMPGEMKDRLYLHEFLQYRYSFMHGIYFDTSESCDRFIQMLKFIPPLLSMGMSALCLYRERKKEE